MRTIPFGSGPTIAGGCDRPAVVASGPGTAAADRAGDPIDAGAYRTTPASPAGAIAAGTGYRSRSSSAGCAAAAITATTTTARSIDYAVVLSTSPTGPVETGGSAAAAAAVAAKTTRSSDTRPRTTGEMRRAISGRPSTGAAVAIGSTDTTFGPDFRVRIGDAGATRRARNIAKPGITASVPGSSTRVYDIVTTASRSHGDAGLLAIGTARGAGSGTTASACSLPTAARSNNLNRYIGTSGAVGPIRAAGCREKDWSGVTTTAKNCSLHSGHDLGVGGPE